MPGDVTPPTSPWYFEAQDYRGAIISISVPFDTTTQALLGATVHRDAACVYTHIYLGLGPDDTPDTSPYVFTVPAGSTNITAKQLSRQGLNTLSDVTSLQITAGT